MVMVGDPELLQRRRLMPLSGVAATQPANPFITPTRSATPSIMPPPPPSPPPSINLQPYNPSGGPNIALPPPGAQPGTDTGPLTDFGPGNDLRYTQVNPVDSPRLTKLQDIVDQATGKLSSAPDLTQAARDTMANLEASIGRDRELGLRRIGQSAAKFGRLGSGMVTTDVGNLEDVLRQRELEAERGLSADVAQADAANRRANLSALSGLEDQLFGQGSAKRGELRGERAYQYGVGRDALSDRVLQAELADRLTNSAFDRAATRAQLGMDAAGGYDRQAAESTGAAGDLASLLAYYRSLGIGGRPKSSSPTATARDLPA